MRRFLITSGEPAGIGPDCCLMLADRDYDVQWVVLADPLVMQERAKRLGISCALIPYTDAQSAKPSRKGQLFYLPAPCAAPVHCGQLNPSNASSVIYQLSQAHQHVFSQAFDAMITAPVHKGVINQAGIPFTGHTEFFAALSQSQQVVMLLATPEMKVALATTHLALREVPDAITIDSLRQTILCIHRSFIEQFSIAHPRIAVCGLNPHAGEGGHLGQEEIAVISPVIAELQQQGLQITGPHPADTVFVESQLPQYDVVLAMYHDQGLPVLKHRGFGRAMNVTLGLPYIRTSVDHGTALDLAGTGQADPSSLLAALDMAIQLRAVKAPA